LLLMPIYGRWGAVRSGCEGLLRRAPQHSIIQYNLAHTLAETGQLRASIPIMMSVANREPFWPLLRQPLFQALLSSGRIDEAESLMADALSRWPRRVDFWVGTHRNLLTSNRIDEASAFAADMSKRPVSPAPIVELELILGEALRIGSDVAKHAASERIIGAVRFEPRLTAYGAVTSALLGDRDIPFELLRGYYFGRGSWAAGRSQRPRTGFLFIQEAKPLRSDSRFDVLMKLTGLEHYWSTSSIVPDYRRYV